MKTNIIRPRQAVRLTRAATLCLLALTATLLTSREARAQWTTSGTNTTTTNNVGVGTTTPAYPITVVKDQTGATSVVAFNRTDGPGAQVTMGVGRTLDWSDKYFTFGVTAPSFGVSGLNDVGILHSKGVTLKLGSESSNDINFFTGGYNNTRMTIAGGGNVGVGTTAPLAPIHVATGTSTGGVAFFQKDAASNGVGIGTTNGAGTISGVNSNYTMSTDLLINPFAGNVGIGTSAPAARLHVAGDIRVDGNINAKYQDVAEWVPTTQKLQAGTVVVLDKKHANHVNASTSAYDTRVAGVVSAQPGIVLGEGGDGKALVATTGRVKVKVDATRSPIEIGDLIVTSDMEGVAMKSEPISLGGRQMHAPGTIIGKALESLEKGTGEILVLLSLQ